METYYALYDERGQAQRIGVAESDSDAQQFEQSGFIEIAREVFEALVGQVDLIQVAQLGLLAAAAGALAAARSNLRTAPVDVPDRRDALQALQRRTDSAMDRLTRQYLDGDLTLAQWQRRARDTINANNLAGRALSVGGVDNLDADDLRAIERANEAQARYLARFRRELESDRLSEQQAIARARMYRGSSTPLFEQGAARARGVAALPTYPGVRTSCRSNCQCRWRIERLQGTGNFDCYWELAPVEHCPECEQRGRVFNPLRIRNGIIQPFNPAGIYR